MTEEFQMMESQSESAEAHQAEVLGKQHESHEIVKEIKQEIDWINQNNEEEESSINCIETEVSDLKTDSESSQQCASQEPEVTHEEKRQGNWEGLMKLPPGNPVINTFFNPIWPGNMSIAMRLAVSLLGNIQRQQKPQIPLNIARNCGPCIKTPFCLSGPGIFAGGLMLPQFTSQLPNLCRPRFEPFRPVMGPCGFGMGPPGSYGPRMGLNVGPTGSINWNMRAPGPHGAGPGHMGPPGSYGPRMGLYVGPTGSINGNIGAPRPDTDSVAMKELSSQMKKKWAQQRKNKKLAKQRSIDREQLAKQHSIDREQLAKQCSIDRKWLAKQSSSIPLSNRQSVQPVKKSAKDFLAKTTTPAGQEEKNQPEVVQEKEPEPKPEQKPVKSRPVASTSIPGTVWCVVRTNDGKSFFYNSSKRRSVWKMPEELKNSPDVKKLLSPKPQVKTDKMEQLDVQEGPPSKKIRSEVVTNEVAQKLFAKKKIVVADILAAHQRSVVPLNVRIQQFRELLAENDISAHSTWEKELHKIVFDQRYLLLSLQERKQVFEEYVKDKAEEEHQEQIRKTKEKTDLYKQLLEESNLTVKSTFGEFAAKYSNDERFGMIEDMQDKMFFFLEYISNLVKPEKEEKKVTSDDIGETKEQEDRLQPVSLKDTHTSWQSQREEAIEDFKKFLAEKAKLIKEPFAVFKSRFYRDPRWRTELTAVEKMKLFYSHIDELLEKNREIFWSILDEMDLSLTTVWDLVEEQVEADPRYLNYMNRITDSTRDFKIFMDKKKMKVVKEFHELLGETKLITPDTKAMLQQGKMGVTDILFLMKNDKRYTALDCLSEEREQMLLSYIRELSEKTQLPLT